MATGVIVVVLAWLATPGLFGVGGDAEQRRVIAATVTVPASCTAPDAAETVRFTIAGQQRTGKLTACGHDRDERVDIAVPANPDGGPVEVRSAAGSAGYNTLRMPLALILLTLSCLAGGVYTFLVIRGPRWNPAATR